LAKAAGVTAAGAALPVLSATTSHAATTTSVWDKVAQCESSGDWHINTGNGYYGGLQFTASTWRAYGGARYAATVNRATKDQQITVAEAVLKGQGPGAWPVCSVRAGLTSANGSATPATGTAPSTAHPAVHHTGAPAKTSATHPGGTSEHTVRPAETLSGIAAGLHVPGGWQALYAANHTTVGADPNLIYPGEQLTWRSGQPATTAPVYKPAAAKAAVLEPKAATGTARHTAAAAFVSPISGHVVISEGYGVPGPWQAGHHTGVDLAVPVGTTVHAAGRAPSSRPSGAAPTGAWSSSTTPTAASRSMPTCRGSTSTSDNASALEPRSAGPEPQATSPAPICTSKYAPPTNTARTSTRSPTCAARASSSPEQPLRRYPTAVPMQGRRRFAMITRPVGRHRSASAAPLVVPPSTAPGVPPLLPPRSRTVERAAWTAAAASPALAAAAALPTPGTAAVTALFAAAAASVHWPKNGTNALDRRRARRTHRTLLASGRGPVTARHDPHRPQEQSVTGPPPGVGRLTWWTSCLLGDPLTVLVHPDRACITTALALAPATAAWLTSNQQPAAVTARLGTLLHQLGQRVPEVARIQLLVSTRPPSRQPSACLVIAQPLDAALVADAQALSDDIPAALAHLAARTTLDVLLLLQATDLAVSGPMGARELGSLIKSQYSPEPETTAPAPAWPAEVDATHHQYLRTHTGGTAASWFHATAWAKNWPRAEQGIDLAALTRLPHLQVPQTATLTLAPTADGTPLAAGYLTISALDPADLQQARGLQRQLQREDSEGLHLEWSDRAHHLAHPHSLPLATGLAPNLATLAAAPDEDVPEHDPDADRPDADRSDRAA
jgi:hypothetical protein